MRKRRADRGFAAAVSGNTSLIFALGALPLFLTVGVAIDTGRAYRSQAILQSAADSAALAAAASGLTTDAEVANLVQQYIDANGATAAVAKLTKVDSIVNSAKGTITVAIEGQSPTSLMQLAGIKTMTISAMSEVNSGSQSLEMALVLDNTGSMKDQKIADLKVASKDLIDELTNGAASYSSVKIGIVPFSQYVNVGTINGGAGWLSPPKTGVWTGCVGSRKKPDDESIVSTDPYPEIGDPEFCPAETTPLTTDYARLKGEIDSMVADGNTYIPAGILWGWNLLDSRVPYTEAMTTEKRNAAHGQRVMVLMTDGANTLMAKYPEHEVIGHTSNDAGGDRKKANKLTATLCENVKADDIKLYTVAFNLDADTSATAAEKLTMKDILRDCASDPSMAYDVANGTALKAAFQKIAADLASLHISR